MLEEISCQIFISYAHKDSNYLKDLKAYVREDMFVRTKIWDDHKLDISDGWASSISNNIQQADIVILMITQNFINSIFIYEQELSIALQRRQEGKCIVYPIFLEKYVVPVENVTIMDTLESIKEIQGSKLVSSMDAREKNELYITIAEKLKFAVKKVLRSKLFDKMGQDQNTEKIHRLERRKFFLSLPASKEGRDMRKKYMKHVYKEIDNREFEIEIVPDIGVINRLYEEIEASGNTIEAYTSILEEYISDAFCSIHIISDQTNIGTLDEAQMSLAKKLNVSQIRWYLQKPSSTMDHRCVIGCNVNVYNKLSDELRSMERVRQGDLDKLKIPFFTKNVLLLRSLEAANSRELESLSNRIKISPICDTEIVCKYDDDENIDHTHFHGGFVFYKSTSDMDWIAPMQKEILSAPHRGVYVSEPIEGKTRDIEKLKEILREHDTIIRGRAELSNRVDEFLIYLCLNQKYGNPAGRILS